jgi:hypothetical protein
MSVSLRQAVEAYAASMEFQGSTETMCDSVADELHRLLSNRSDDPNEPDEPSAPGPYEPTGPYRGDHLRQWIVTAGEWKAEAVRLTAENREMRAKLDAVEAYAAEKQWEYTNYGPAIWPDEVAKDLRSVLETK